MSNNQKSNGWMAILPSESESLTTLVIFNLLVKPGVIHIGKEAKHKLLQWSLSLHSDHTIVRKKDLDFKWGVKKYCYLNLVYC